MLPELASRALYRDPRDTFYLTVALALGLSSTYAGYHDPIAGPLQPDSIASSSLAVPLGASQITISLCICLGATTSVVQAIDRGKHLTSWLLVAAPVVGGAGGSYTGTLVAGHLMWLTPVIGVAGIGASILYTLAVFTLVGQFDLDIGADGRSPDVFRLLGLYSFLFVGTAAVFLLLLGALTVTILGI